MNVDRAVFALDGTMVLVSLALAWASQPLLAAARSLCRHGLESGVACALCCAGFMTVLLVAGVMDLRVMAVVAAAITFERLAPWPAFAARAAGVLAVAAGAFALVRALGAA